MKIPVLVVGLCVVTVFAQSNTEGAGFRAMLKVYDECSKSDFSTCLKKKAITFLDRLGRMERLALVDGITLIKSPDVEPVTPVVTENEIDQNLPRTLEGKDEFLNKLLLEKAGNLLGSRTIEISVPKVSELVEEGRDGDFGGSGGGGGGGKRRGGGKGGGGGKMKNMMGGMMMAIAAKMAALIPVAIAGLFLLAGKALITAKIALLISGIIAVKKLFAAKNQQHTASVHSGWSSGGGGGGGGWQPSGGGWDRRSLEEAQLAAYKNYKQS
ncbi:hypothetical protein GWI33_013205 [Rhynchophorus ferrugineus]|uniref:Uncharacterized protein n=1 Tax=Rhynchophorus ferrugineus TaxID=354439 RepID=A0A834I6Y1_RHYFE|nr:hypothetical protein GWI33_013205 [Rhynchophorus ferrugineus]